MEAQSTRPQEHYYEQQYPEVRQLSPEGVQDDQHHEKKSVLKKVKAKAMKLKDTLKLHAHGHNHDQEHVPDDHDLDEEDDDDEEETFSQQDQQFGGVSRQPAAYEAAAVTGSVPGHVEHIDSQQGSRVAMQEENASGYIRGTALPVQDVGNAHPELDVDRSTPIKEVPDTPLNTPAASFSSTNATDKLRDNADPLKPIAREQEASGGTSEKVLEGQIAMEEEHPYNLKLADQSRHDVDLTKPSLHEHEMCRGQLEKVLEGTTAMEQDHPHGVKPADQSRDNVDLTKLSLREQETNRGQPGKVLEAMEEDRHAPKDRLDDYEPSNYESKVTDPTGIGGKEAGISPMLQSFGEPEVKETYPEELRGTQQSMLPTGSHDQFAPEPTPQVPISKHESATHNHITSETQRITTEGHEHPTEKPSNQSSYTDKVAAATSPVAEKAVVAKNAIASKLGCGEKEQKSEEDNKKPASPGGYIKTITTVAEKLTPVYEKVAGAGSAVTSKVQGKGSSNEAASNTVKVRDEKQEAEDNIINTSQSPRGNSKTITGAVSEKLSPVYGKVKETGSVMFSKVQGSGTSNEVDGRSPEGASVTSFIAEKLKPGEEDKALSEVIKEKLHKPKEEAEKPPIERVTESEEVKRYLGGSLDESGAGVDTNTKGVVDKLKGAVGSWFGKNEETAKGSQQSVGSTTGTEGFPTSMGTGGLQESGT